MNVGSWLRRNGFWIYDRLFLHGEFKRIYLETKQAYHDGIDIRDTQKKLELLLEHASNTTRYYAPYKGIRDLEKWPIVNKRDYQKQWDNFVSTKCLHDKKCHMVHTSGSTGTPLGVLYDQRKTRRRFGTSIFLNTLADYEIGDKQINLRCWTNREPSFLQKRATNLIPWDTSNLDEQHLRELCDVLAQKRIKSITGYASSLAVLSEYIREEQVDCSGFEIQSIIYIGEALSLAVRKQLREQFACPVCGLYGAEELGTVGVQEKDSEGYYVDASGMFFEVLKLDEDVPAEDGELGRLLITDLCNYAFPIIRYNNGDTVIRKTVHLPNGRYQEYFSQIYGRTRDLIYGTDGKPRSPVMFTTKMWGIENIVQWKFVQTGKTTYKFVINGDQSKIDESYICGLFRNDLGADAVISFEYVDEIPVLNSGKRRCIENQYILPG